MSEFWTESIRRETGWKYYKGPNGLLKDVRDDGKQINIRYHSPLFSSVIGIGKSEKEAIDDWLETAEEEVEEAERELDALQEAIAAIREHDGK